MTQPASQIECYRCSGTGYYQWMTHSGRLDGGPCFRCKGTGIDPHPAHAERTMKLAADREASYAAAVERAKASKAEEEARREAATEIRHAQERVTNCRKMLADAEADGNSQVIGLWRVILAEKESELAALTR